MNQLQKSLRANALFSGISGITLITLSRSIAELFGTENNTVFWITGIALIVFSATIVYEIAKQRPLAILWIIVQDFLWVIGSIVLLVFNPFSISSTGMLIIGLVALIVLYMAINQASALGKVDAHPTQPGKQWQFERIVNADKTSVWQLISDIGNYDMFAPNIDNVTIVSGEGEGMVRACSHGKDSWTETCSLWNEGKSYAYTVHTDKPDYPYPFKLLKGFWAVEEINESTTKIIMRFDFQYRHRFQNVLLHPLFRAKFSKVAEELLDNWQRELEKQRLPVPIDFNGQR
ncbi:MAG: SRPBCC family protein [Bacteroidota bacterium]